MGTRRAVSRPPAYERATEAQEGVMHLPPQGGAARTAQRDERGRRHAGDLPVGTLERALAGDRGEQEAGEVGLDQGVVEHADLGRRSAVSAAWSRTPKI